MRTPHRLLLSSSIFFLACGPSTSNNSTTGGSSGGTAADTFAWAESLTTSPNTSHIAAAAADASGVVVVGQITGTATIGAQSFTSDSSEGNAFVAKLDTTGNVLWAHLASGDQSLFEAVTIDSDGNIFIFGTDYGDTPNGFTFVGNNVPAGGVVLALDTSGNVQWLNFVETSLSIDGAAIALSANNVIVAGSLDGNAALGLGGVSPITTCSTDGCVFLGSFGAATGDPGFLQIAASTPSRNNAGASEDDVWAATDASGNIFLAIGAGSSVVTNPQDANQVVLNKYDPSGTIIWAKSAPMPAGGGPDVNGLGIDASGNAYIVGDNGNWFGQGAGLQFGTTTIQSNGSFVVKYSASGDVVWVTPSSDSTVFATSSLAAGADVYTFGNGEAPSLPSDSDLNMVLTSFDSATGTIKSQIPCGVGDQGDGRVVSVSGSNIYIAGEGAAPGNFGLKTTTTDGFFVAKTK